MLVNKRNDDGHSSFGHEESVQTPDRLFDVRYTCIFHTKGLNVFRMLGSWVSISPRGFPALLFLESQETLNNH